MLLEIRRGGANHRERRVCEPLFLVGAAQDCDMVLADGQFLPIHFYLLKRKEQTLLRCVGRAPEVSVNGEVRTSIVLQDGDRIRTGPFEFRVRAA